MINKTITLNDLYWYAILSLNLLIILMSYSNTNSNSFIIRLFWSIVFIITSIIFFYTLDTKLINDYYD